VVASTGWAGSARLTRKCEGPYTDDDDSCGHAIVRSLKPCHDRFAHTAAARGLA
jgi:hypothetical protein